MDIDDEALKKFNKAVAKILSANSVFSRSFVAECMYNILVDEISVGLCFEAHRGVKTGFLRLDNVHNTVPAQYRTVDKPGLDVLGQPLIMKRLPDVKCPVCSRHIACTRFAPHLEKCMGMGRSSSRVANRRLVQRSLVMSASDDEDSWATGSEWRATSGNSLLDDEMSMWPGSSSKNKRRRSVGERKTSSGKSKTKRVAVHSSVYSNSLVTESNVSMSTELIMPLETTPICTLSDTSCQSDEQFFSQMVQNNFSDFDPTNAIDLAQQTSTKTEPASANSNSSLSQRMGSDYSTASSPVEDSKRRRRSKYSKVHHTE